MLVWLWISQQNLLKGCDWKCYVKLKYVSEHNDKIGAVQVIKNGQMHPIIDGFIFQIASG